MLDLRCHSSCAVFASLVWSLPVSAQLAGDKKACPKCTYGLPSTYAVANGRSRGYTGEYFDVYSRPIKTMYGEVINVFNYSPNAPSIVRLPPEIVSRFAGRVMAITGFEPNIVEFDAEGRESLVPCTAMYNHHWSHVLLGADSPPVMTDSFEYYDYVGAGAASRGGNWSGPPHHALHKIFARRVSPKPTAPFGGALSRSDDALKTAPTAQFFSEGNGNEHRLSFHGYPRGYGQLVRSPVAFAPGIMFINTKDVTGTSRTGHGTVVPKVALADGDVEYSALLECPCSTRRRIDVERGTIDGNHVGFGCDFEGEGTGVGRAMMKQQNNTACHLATLHGGSKCCDNGMVLIDKDQPQPDVTSTFYYKQRFYFDDASKGYTNLFRVYWQAELKNNEYDVPVCPHGTAPEECIFVMTNEGVARETLWPADPTAPAGWGGIAWPSDGTGIQLVYAGGHCHVGCISLDLVNLDTGATICHQEPVRGTRVGKGGNAMEEAGYAVAIPPCLWGDDPRDGLSPPVVIKPTDRLQIIARYNATRMRHGEGADPSTLDIAHYGVMSMFQMRASYERPPGFHV